MIRLVVLFTVSILTASLFAAVPNKGSISKKKSEFVENGKIIGGHAGSGFSLLNVRRDYSKKVGLERVVFDLGDIDGKPLKNKVSYFQAQVSQFPPRVILDLSQVQKSGLDEKVLQKRFAKSPLVKKVYLSYDPEDLSTNMVFEFKKAVKISMSEAPSGSKASRIIMDIKQKQ